MATNQFLGTRFQSFKDDGTVNASGTVEFFETGGAFSTYITTYSDSGLTSANSNVITLNSAGCADIWAAVTADVRIKDSSGTVVDTLLNWNPTSTSTSSNTAYNAILNGSFEDGTDGTGNPSNWTVALYTGGSESLDTSSQGHGQTSLKFTSTGSGGGYVTSEAFFPVTPSELYEFSWLMKSTVADVRNLIQIFWYKADQSASATASTDAYDDSTTNPTSWTRKTYNATAPADAYYAKVRLTGCHSSDATSGSTYFDDVYFIAAKIYGSRTYAGAVSLTGAISLTGAVTASNTITMSSKSLWFAEGADVASTGDCNIWTTDGNTVHVTGTTTISDWGTAPQAGAIKFVIFDGALQLTYDATTNKLNTGGKNYTTVAGDRAIVYAESTSSYVVTIFPLNLSLKPLFDTKVASTSGTTVSFTSVPSWARMIVVMLDQVSTNSASNFILQIGSGSMTTSGYNGAAYGATDGSTATYTSQTTGFTLGASGAAGDTMSGNIILTNPYSNMWLASGTIFRKSGGTNVGYSMTGYLSLSGTLDRFQVNTTGSDTFDNGNVNATYF